MSSVANSSLPHQERPLEPDVTLRLQEILPTLVAFGRNEEAQFVEIGQSLGGFLQKSRLVTRLVEDVLGHLLHSDGDDALQALVVLVNDLEQASQQLSRIAGNHRSVLQEVALTLQRIDEPLMAFSKVVKVLQALSVSTRIESSQGTSPVVLQNLANDLKGLAHKIDARIVAVRDRLRMMLTLASIGKEETQRVAIEHMRQCTSRINACRTLIDELEEHRVTSLDGARWLQESSTRLSDAMAEIISSMQFHDITRQQVDHVRLALQDYCQNTLKRVDSSDGRGSSLGRLCQLQAAQLRHTRHDLVSAVIRIIDNLDSIAPDALEMATKTHALTLTNAAGGVSFFQQIEDVLTTVTSLLHLAEDEDRQMGGAVQAVLVALDELNDLLKDFALIGIEMKLIAFNAGITAAHNSARGAGLGVIALTIQDLSQTVLGRSKEFSSLYEQLQHLTGALSAEGWDTIETGGESLNDRAVTLLLKLQEMGSAVQDSLQRLDANALDLSNGVVATAGTIKIHEEAGKIFNTLIEDLESLAMSAQSPQPSGDTAKILHKVAHNYTMQSERRVHAQTSHAPEDDLLSPPLQRPPGADPTGLGENIELF